MDARTAETEQRSVRVGAILVHAGALFIAAVLVVFSAFAAAAAALAVAAVAGGWALKMYGDLQAQAIQDRAMVRAADRFSTPPPVAPARDPFEG